MEDESVIRVNARIAIPLRELELHYVRATGPGGQNVNKVATKAVLRFDVQGSPSIPEPGRTRALTFLASRLTRDGALVLTSSIHRSQLRNREAVIERLRQLLAEAVVVPKRRRPTRPTTAARERRLTEKKARGRLKRERGELD